MPRGNPDNLRAAAQRKHQAATERAETALDALITSGEPITFRGLAKTAGVSIDFLYRSPLRARVEQLRAEQQRTPPAPRPSPSLEQPPSQSNVVRALTAQLDRAQAPPPRRDRAARSGARRRPGREPRSTTPARPLGAAARSVERPQQEPDADAAHRTSASSSRRSSMKSRPRAGRSHNNDARS